MLQLFAARFPMRCGPLVASVLLWLVGATLWAAPTSQLILPANTQTTRSDFQLRFDFRWVAGNGYRPIRVTVAPRNKAFLADRHLEITLESELGTNRRMTVRKKVLLPAGSTGIVDTIYAPEALSPYALKLRVLENGREHRELRFEGAVGIVQGRPEDRPRILIIDSDTPPGGRRNTWVTRWPRDRMDRRALPDFRVLAWSVWRPDILKDRFSGSTSDAKLLGLLENLPELELLHPSDLPDRWIGYSSLDLVFISLTDLKQLTEQDPIRWEALRSWVATGPVLCVYGAADSREPFSHLPALERALRVPPLARSGGENLPYRGWRVPLQRNFARKDSPFRNDLMQRYGQSAVVVQRRMGRSPNISGRTERPPDPFADRRPLDKQRMAAMFVYRSLGLGRVVALGNPQGFPGTRASWQWLFHTLHPRQPVRAPTEVLGSPSGTQRLTWMGRHGMSLMSGNVDYWNWLVPGVGLPPVTTFLVLISLFVIVIGPVNYWVLRRAKKLFLLLVTVPAGASLVTLFLLGYALFADGLGIRGRARSLTHLDQASGLAVSWSRQTYYAAIAPSRGLSFPNTSVVYQIESNISRRRNADQRARDVTWGDRQVLSGGYLRSRVAGQFLVVTARPASIRLEIDESSATPRVKNRLEKRIVGLVLRDAAGRWFGNGARSSVVGGAEILAFGDAIAANEEATLVPLSDIVGSELLQSAYQRQRPQEPEGFDRTAYNRGFNSVFYYQNEEVPTFQNSVLESLNRADWRLAPRSYVAVMDGEVLDSRGIAEASTEGGVHVLVGEW